MAEQAPQENASEDQKNSNDKEEKTTEPDVQQQEATRIYFGFGSNMSHSNFTKAKSMKPISIRRGILPNMRLVFNLSNNSKGTSCVANIERSDTGEQVHGCIAELTESDMQLLTKWEASGYDRRKIQAIYYPEDLQKHKDLPANGVQVEVFINDEKTEKPMVTRVNSGKPTQNYLQTIINGAKELQLDAEYIQKLENTPYLKPEAFAPTDEQWKVIHATTFKMEDVEQQKEKYFVVKGLVFQIDESAPLFVKQGMGGKDLTMRFLVKRWAFYADYEAELTCLEDVAKEKFKDLHVFMNDTLQQLLNGTFFGSSIAGKLDDTEKYNISFFKW